MTFTTFLLWFFGIVYVASCLFLILVVLLQEGKSGGMAGMDSAAQSPQAMTESFGASGSQKGLFNVTTVCATLFFVLAVVLTTLANKRDHEGGTLDLLDEEPAASATLPVTAAPEPVAGETAPVAPAAPAPASN